MSRIRYIIDERTPEPKVPDQYKIFMDSVKSKIREKVVTGLTNGTLTYIGLYEKLGWPMFNAFHSRLELPYPYLEGLIEEINQGILQIEYSSWGKYEIEEDPKKKETSPGVGDFFPRGFGYNSVGGPTYNLYFSRDSIVVRANFAHQEISGWDSIHIDVLWETREFRIVPVGEDVQSEEAFLKHFRRLIIDKFVDNAMSMMNQNAAESMASVIFEKQTADLGLTRCPS